MPTTTLRYFHGTCASLKTGGQLVPGNTIGRNIHFNSDHVYAIEVSPETDPMTAADAAAEWAAMAADLDCTNPTHTYQGAVAGFHHDCWRDGTWPDCFHVYEVTPDGPVEADPFAEPQDGSACVRTSAATIAGRVNQCGELN